MPRIPVINTSHLDRIDELLVDNIDTGEFKLHRSVFTDEALFDLEMKYIFEGNWVYLAHESQIPNNNDYYTTHIGRQPVIIARNRNGELNAMINACSHRGAQLCRHKRGNKATYTCPFHGWTFNNSGKLLKVKDPSEAGYSDCFNQEGSHDLKKVARFESYKGFLFGSLNPDVPSLEEFLGETTKIIDMIVDQSEHGLEVLRGSHRAAGGAGACRSGGGIAREPPAAWRGLAAACGVPCAIDPAGWQRGVPAVVAVAVAAAGVCGLLGLPRCI